MLNLLRWVVSTVEVVPAGSVRYFHDMRVAAISDLHIGAREYMDSFCHRADDFQRFLDRLEAEHDHIVLLGDVYQCDHGWRMDDLTATRQLFEARARTDWLTQRLTQSNYTFVHGNHDWIARDVLDVPTEVVLGEPGRQVLLTHGDQFDPFVGGKCPWLSPTATWMTGRLRAAWMRPIASWLERSDVAVKARRLQTPSGPYAAGAEMLMCARDVQFVIFGHTHVPWRLQTPQGVLLNSGTCSGGRLMMASVDTETGQTEARILSV